MDYISTLNLNSDKAHAFETIENGLYPAARYEYKSDNPRLRENQLDQLRSRRHLMKTNFTRIAKGVKREWGKLPSHEAREVLLDWYRDCLQKAEHKQQRQNEREVKERRAAELDRYQQTSLLDLEPDPSLAENWSERFAKCSAIASAPKPKAEPPATPSPVEVYRYVPRVQLPCFVVGERVKTTIGEGTVSRVDSYVWVRYPHRPEEPHDRKYVKKICYQTPVVMVCSYSDRVAMVRVHSTYSTRFHAAVGFQTLNGAKQFVEFLQQRGEDGALQRRPKYLPFPFEVWAWGLSEERFNILVERSLKAIDAVGGTP